MRVGVITKDKYLLQKIRLILSEDLFLENNSNLIPDVLLTDDKVPEGFAGRVITMKRQGDCRLRIPFTEEELNSVLFEDGNKNPLITLGNKAATLYSESISLTELEYSLLSMLIDAKGEFVSRERLLNHVWGEGVTDGVLNVYIHYLREKLEKNGEKIIISSRKYGYKISERYVVGCLE